MLGRKSLSHVWFFETPWLLCLWRFSRQEYWCGLPCPPPGDLPNPWIEPRSPTLQAHSLLSDKLCPEWYPDQQLFQETTAFCLLLLLSLLAGSLYIQFSSVAQSCPTLCDPTDSSKPGFPVHPNSQSLLKLMSIESVMPSNHLILCHPLLLPPSIFASIRVFLEPVLCIRWPKYWSFSFSISPSNKYTGLVSFRIDWLDLLTVQGTLKNLLQHHSSKASILQCSAFFHRPALTSIHDYWKNHGFNSTDLC